MKPWQSKTTAPVPRPPERAPFSVAEHVQGIALLLAQSQPFWRETGKKRPLVAQFRVPGDERSSWFVQVDGRGGAVSRGLHPAPSVTWESDLEAMQAAFGGKLLPGRIRVHGDFEEMRALFAAIAQTRVPGVV